MVDEVRAASHFTACFKEDTPMTRTLFTPFKLGKLELRNRVVMAPMTR